MRIGEGTVFRNINTLGAPSTERGYVQEASGTTWINGTFQNSGGRVNNQGAMTVGTTGAYIGGPGTTTNSGIFSNAGQVRIGEGTGFYNVVLPDRPSSLGQYVQLTSGTTWIDGTFHATGGRVNNEGTMTVGRTGEYSQNLHPVVGQAATTANSGTFTNAGHVRIGEGTFFSNFPTLALNSPPAVGGQYIQQAGGITQIDGSFLNGGGRVTNEGAITVGTTGTYSQTRSGAPVPATPTTVNTGSFTNAGTTRIEAGTFTNQGSVVNSGAFQVGVNGTATLANQGTVVNAGTFEVGTHGQVSGTGSYVQNAAAAQTIVNGTFAHNISLQAGTLTGAGTIQGTVQNSGGLLLPGNNGLGTLTIKGQYAQGFGGTFGVNLAGLSSFGLLAVQGTGAAVTLGGSLQVGLLTGFRRL